MTIKEATPLNGFVCKHCNPHISVYNLIKNLIRNGKYGPAKRYLKNLWVPSPDRTFIVCTVKDSLKNG